MFLGSKYASGFQPRSMFCVEDDYGVIETSYLTDQFKFSLLCSVHTRQVESFATSTVMLVS